MNHRWMLLWSSALGASGVAAGAFGAHGLKNQLPASGLEVWDIAVRYQLLHAVVVLILFVLVQQWASRLVLRTAQLLLAGTLCFSGSLYLLALTGIKWFGPITPLGGVFLIAGWLTLFYAACKIQSTN
ncbi:MAG: DUF423 domain-containing protein [Tolumonas sp.]|nr:DUF423 domain-containing protein [Tolumonas sp.]